MSDTLPLYLDPAQTRDTILGRMLDASPDTEDKNQGSFLFDSLSPAAFEFSQVIYALRLLSNRAYISTSYSGYLDLIVQQHGIYRIPAHHSSALVRFYGTDGTVIPPGSTVSTPATATVAPWTFTNDFSGTVGETTTGFVDISFTATQAGAGGNVPASTITALSSTIAGITSVTNPASAKDGSDAETDAALRARAIIAIASPKAGGNRGQYIGWALSVAGVGGVNVVPVRDGPGTVAIIIVDLNKNPASLLLVNKVQDYIAPNFRVLDPAIAMQATVPNGLIATDTAVNFYWANTGNEYITDSVYTTNGAINILRQAGLWKAKATLSIKSIAGAYVGIPPGLQPVFGLGIWNTKTRDWCNTTVAGQAKAIAVFSASQLPITSNSVNVQFYWTGSDLIEARCFRINTGTLSTPSAPASFAVASVSGGTIHASASLSYKITAGNIMGETVGSSAGTYTVPANGSDLNQISFSWTPVSGATSYNVYGRTSGSEFYIATVMAPSGTSPAYTDTGVVVPSTAPPASNLTAIMGVPKLPTLVEQTSGGTFAAGTYYYKITATNTYGETLPSSEASVLAVGSTSSILIQWDPVTGATGYKVYRTPVNTASAEKLIATLTYTANGQTHIIINSGTTYDVTGFVTAWTDTNSGTLSATSPPGSDTTIPAATIGHPGALTLTTAATGGTLPGATFYSYRLTSLSTTGETLPTPIASTSLISTVAGTNTNTISLAWPSVTSATGYKIYGRSLGSELLMATWNGSTWSTGSGTATTWTDDGSASISGVLPTTNTTSPYVGPPGAPTFASPVTTGGHLTGSTTYYYRVSALNSLGETMAGAEGNYTTASNILLTNSVTVGWATSSGATGYKIYRGTTSGAEKLVGTVGAVTSWADVGTAVGTSALPLDNTTGFPDKTSVIALESVTYSSMFSKVTGDAQAPIGASVTVEPAIPVTVNVAMQLTIDTINYSVVAVQQAVTAALQNYLQGLTFAAQGTVPFTRMLAVSDEVAGVLNVNAQTFRLNGAVDDISINTQQIAVLGTVTFS